MRASFWVLAVLFLQCLIGTGLEAQTYPASCLRYPACSVNSLYNASCQSQLPPGVFNCFNAAPFVWQCSIKTYQCGDAPPCPTCCTKCSGGKPINLSTGNTFINQNDLSVPGLGGGLTVSRTWNSLSAGTLGLFGPGWRSTYEENVSVASNGYIAYSRGDGSIWWFGYFEGESPATYLVMVPANGSESLLWDGTNWTVIFKSGEKRTFSGVTGNLLSISDRNGNTLQLSYDASNRLTTVTDAASRHLYFAYNGSGALVTGITSDVGISTSYSYDNQSRLSQVTKPDLTTVSFQYDTFSRITTVADSQGKLLESHTYDLSSRGLTSSQALGVDAITATYQ